MKKIILSKVAVHANPAKVVKAMVKKYGSGVFYDSVTHSVVKLVEEPKVEKEIEKEEEKKTLDAKDAENLLDQNTRTVKKSLEGLSSIDLSFLLETEKAGKNRKKVISAIEEKL